MPSSNLISSIKAVVLDSNGRQVRPNSVIVAKTVAGKLGISRGDCLSVKSKNKETFVIVSEIDKKTDEMHYVIPDGLTRINANVAPGEEVELTVVKDVPISTRIVIGPANPDQTLTTDPNKIKQLLQALLVSNSQRIRLPTTVFGLASRSEEDSTVMILDSNPSPALVTPETQVVVKCDFQQVDRVTSSISFDDIGGLKEQITKIRHYVMIPLRNSEVMKKLGIESPKGVLLSGPPGTGKTKFVKAAATESNFYFEQIRANDIGGPDGPRIIRQVFSRARENSPSIIFIDEIDFIANKREDTFDPDSKRVLSTLLEEMDGMKDRGDVAVIAATNRPEAIDQALRRPGRFDLEIEIPIPDEAARLQIFKIHTKRMPLEDVNLEELASKTHGFSGSDILLACKNAAIECIKRNYALVRPDNVIEDSDDLRITMDDFKNGLKNVSPSLGREIFSEIANVGWDDVAGYNQLKQMLEKNVINKLRYRKFVEHMGFDIGSKMIFYGPPGTGKTYLAKALANKLGLKVITVTASTILSKWVGEGEQNVKKIFNVARKSAPVMMIWEEGDALGASRSMQDGSGGATSRILNEILTEIDGTKGSSDIIMVMTTNRLDLIDPALKRPGRFSAHIEISSLDRTGRAEVLKVHTKKLNLSDDVDFEKLADLTKGDSPAALNEIAEHAFTVWFNEIVDSAESEEKIPELLRLTPISQYHFEQAIQQFHSLREK